MQISWLRGITKFEDRNGQLRVLFCGICLFFSHALRDYLITGIPYLVLEENSTRNQTSSADQVEWTSFSMGMCMGSVHLGSLLSLLIIPFVCNRFSVNSLIICFLWATGFLSLFSQVCYGAGPWGLMALRLFIGMAQGPILLFIYIIIRELELGTFTAVHSFIFLAPWLGSSIGMLLAAVMDPFISTYIMSIGVLLMAVFAIKLPLGYDCDLAENNAWKEALSSKPVRSCVGLHTATVYVIHTFLLGLPFTLCFKLANHPWWWVLIVMTTVSGVVMRCLGVVPLWIINTSLLSALNRRRVLISTGSIIALVFLAMCGTMGLEEKATLMISSAIGLIIGTNLSTLGIRMSLHDLAPIFPIPVLLLANAGASFGAMLASILFPSLAMLDYPDQDFGMWVNAWILPCIFVTASTVAYLLLLSVNPLPHQVILCVQHHVDVMPPKSTRTTSKSSSADIDTKSFKSLHSAVSFKTVLSSMRRSSSFNTIAENTDIEIKSIPGSDLNACKTATEGSIDDMKSVGSSSDSFKTVKCNASVVKASPHIVLDAEQLDRTTAWLTAHHSTGSSPRATASSTDKLRAQRNMLLPLQW